VEGSMDLRKPHLLIHITWRVLVNLEHFWGHKKKKDTRDWPLKFLKLERESFARYSKVASFQALPF